MTPASNTAWNVGGA